MNDAASKGKKAELKQQLAEANEALEDTIRDHVYETQVQGLDDLQTQLQENFDEWVREMALNLEAASDTITTAIENTGEPLYAISTALETLLGENFGISSGDLANVGYKFTGTGYAKGTKRVGTRSTALTMEDGREMILTKNGILTQLEPKDAVIPNNLTENLFEAAKNYPAIASTVGVLARNLGNGNNSNVNINQHYDSLITIQGSADAATVQDIKNITKDILEQSYNYTSKRMNQDYVRTGGLRKAY